MNANTHRTTEKKQHDWEHPQENLKYEDSVDDGSDVNNDYGQQRHFDLVFLGLTD